MHIVVVGAGVIGVALAYRLVQAGARVTILEAGERVGGGTSGLSFAWTNANEKTPRDYHALNVAGMQAHQALRDEFGSLPWWHGGGSVDWYANDAARTAQAARVERLNAWGYAAEWISSQQLHELEPDIDLAAVGDAPIAFYPAEGWLDPIVYLHAMLRSAQRLGAALRTGALVEQLVLSGGRVAGVALRGGEHLPADLVVNCAGRWADTLRIPDAPTLTLPLAPTLGLLVLTPPVASSLQRVVHSPFVNLRPDGAGRLMLHADDADAALTPATEPGPGLPIAHTMVRRAALVLHGMGEVKPEAVRIGVRAIPADGLSAVALPGGGRCR